MKLSPIITALRKNCPALKNRVGGAAEYAAISVNSSLPMPYAFVVPLGDTADYFEMATDYRQGITGQFAVLLFVNLRRDPRGRDAYDESQDVKAQVFRAILGATLPDANEIVYDGETIIDVNKAYMVIQWEFNVPYDIVDSNTAHGAMLEALEDFEGIDSVIDPAPADYIDAIHHSINLKEGG